MKTSSTMRLALVAAGLTFAAPSFASVVPLCGDHGEKVKNEEKKSEPKKESKDEKKKPVNQG